jgi:hypothetical protein
VGGGMIAAVHCFRALRAMAVTFVRSLLWTTPETSFDAAFSNQD